MKKTMLFIMLSMVLNSCAYNLEQERFNFDNFKDTPLWDLAKAVRDNNASDVKKILKSKKIDVDFKDPKFQQTLLALSIQNLKEDAFTALLNAGANPNELLGNPKDVTPFIYAIQNVDNCDLFYIENLLKHGANPNFEITNPRKGYDFENSFPLLSAIGIRSNNGAECLDMVKYLVDNGANINYCYQNPMTNMCEGVINKCLISNSMEELRYFVIEKKIVIPDNVYVIGAINKETQEVYSLSKILNTEDYQFKNIPRLKKAKDDVLAYLKSVGKD